MITPDQFEAHVVGLYDGARIFTAEQVAKIEGVSIRTVWNEASLGMLVGDGRGQLRRYKLWDIYQWHLKRRQPKARELAVKAKNRQGRAQSRATRSGTQISGRKAQRVKRLASGTLLEGGTITLDGGSPGSSLSPISDR